MTKNISLLGSTGSIGTQSLDVARLHGYNIKCLTANSKVDVIENQVREFHPDLVCMMNENAAKELKTKISDTATKVTCGMQGLIECATYDGADTVLNSVVGMVGLQPTLEAIKAKKTIALANKETLVAGGHLVTNAARENGVSILPVDSEHSAIFQAIIQKATAYDAADRYETVRLFKEALEQDLKTACPSVSHLTIKNISVFGSKPGIGTTHIAIALASTLTANGYPAVYTERNGNNHLRSMLQEHPAVKEQNGICYYKYFRGIPDYGQGIELPGSKDAIYVKDFGVYHKDIIELGPENFNLFILSGSPWDLAQTISAGLELSGSGNTAFICNYNNPSSAKKLAGKLGCKVYCFPFDGDAFTCTETKTDLFFHVLSFERGKKKFLNFRKRQP